MLHHWLCNGWKVIQNEMPANKFKSLQKWVSVFDGSWIMDHEQITYHMIFTFDCMVTKPKRKYFDKKLNYNMAISLYSAYISHMMIAN